MTFLDAHRIPRIGQSGDATAEGFRHLFTEDSLGLYLLSFLLTANNEKAEQCFVAGLNDFAHGNMVFQEWAGSWAQRVIVRNAIRIIRPHNGQAKPTKVVYEPPGISTVPKMPVQDIPFASILRLNEFERFVYVLSVLECFSDQECVALLGISGQEVRDTRALALQHLSDCDPVVTESTTDPSRTGIS